MTDTQPKTVFSRKDQPALLAAALTLTNSQGWMNDAHALGAFEGEHLIAVAVFQKITVGGAETHFASTGQGWANREILRTLFKYAFDVQRHPLLSFPIAIDDAKTQICALKSGARLSGIQTAGVLMNKDATVYSMTRSMCNWIDPITPRPPENERLKP